MSRQVIIGFTTEGQTDTRFLESIIHRSFEDVAFECSGQVEVLPIQYIERQKGSFVAVVTDYAQHAEKLGMMVLCVHADADAKSDIDTFNNKIIPAFIAVRNEHGKTVCKNLVAIVPVQMTEAWMLSDKDLLRSEIGTGKSDVELGIHKSPEGYADPKQAIEAAIRVAGQDFTKRRRHKLTIAELYLPLGQKISLAKLEILPSYPKFKEAVQVAFKKLGYL